MKNIEIIVCTKRKHDKFLKQKKCKIHVSIDDCIKENPKFAIVANETSFHIKTATYLAKAGIHMLIEKPLSHSLTGTDKLLNIVKKKKLTVLIGCNLRFHPCLKKIKELLLKEKIGRIISVHADNGSYLPDWHSYEDYRKSYAAKKDLGGGVTLTCIHEIDYLYWLFGRVLGVTSVIGKYSDLDITAEDLASIIMRFKSNIITEIHLDYFQRPTKRTCRIVGTKGTIVCNFITNEVKMYNIQNGAWKKLLKIKNFNNNQMYKDELSHFINCIKKKKKTVNPLEEEVEVLNIALMIKRSSKEGKWIKI